MNEENIQENQDQGDAGEESPAVEKATSDRLILRTNGEPFRTQKAAEIRQGQLSKRPTKVVKISGGFALEVIDKAEARKMAKKRIPIGTRQRLTAPARKGYVRRFFNDDGDRIKRAADAGWTPVTTETLNIDNPGGVGDPRINKPKPMGAPVTEVVDREGKIAYLMEIPEEWFNEDMIEKRKVIDRFEDEIRAKPHQQGHYGKVEIGKDAV